MAKLSHIDATGRPTMVDVSDKVATRRTAVAQSIVRLPPLVAEALAGAGFRTAKGPVFDTAIVAGVMCQHLCRCHCSKPGDLHQLGERLLGRGIFGVDDFCRHACCSAQDLSSCWL